MHTHANSRLPYEWNANVFDEEVEELAIHLQYETNIIWRCRNILCTFVCGTVTCSWYIWTSTQWLQHGSAIYDILADLLILCLCDCEIRIFPCPNRIQFQRIQGSKLWCWRRHDPVRSTISAIYSSPIWNLYNSVLCLWWAAVTYDCVAGSYLAPQVNIHLCVWFMVNV